MEPRMYKKYRNTVTWTNGQCKIWRLYNTDIVCKDGKGNILLNNGLWYTNTTKNRINEILSDLGISGKVTQLKYKWYFRGQPFVNGMKINKDNEIEYPKGGTYEEKKNYME